MATTYRAPREWTRVHPVSPLLQGWAVGALVLAYLAQDWIPSILMGPEDGLFEFADRFPLLWVLLSAVGIILVVLAFAYWAWSRTEYRVSDDTVYLRKGIVNKQERQARLDRMQAVDLNQPLLARVFGFAGVSIQVAGGADSSFELSYLRLGDAEALRNEILYLAAGLKRASAPVDDAVVAEDGTPTSRLAGLRSHARERVDALSHPGDVLRGTERFATEIAAAQEQPVYKVPVGRLLGSIALSGPTIILLLIPIGLVVGAAIASQSFGDTVVVAFSTGGAGAIGALLGLAGFFWSQLNRGFGFTAAIASDGVRLKHGMVDTRRQTVPPGRVQAVALSQPFLWRRTDWWVVKMNVAGYGDSDETVTILHPVATRAEALRAVWLVLPDLGDPDPAGTLGHALSGKDDQGGFLPSPPQTRRINPFQWRHRGVRATERALLIRSGRWGRALDVVPHERTQSLELLQGPLERRLGLATVVVASTEGPVDPRAKHLALEDAIKLLDAQADRAREARRRQTPEQWMRAVGLDEAAMEANQQ